MTNPKASYEQWWKAAVAQLDADKTPHSGLAVLEGVYTPVVLVGCRGYYRDSQGRVGVNDRNCYDDGIAMLVDGKVVAVNGNTDPIRLGWNAGVGKPFAELTLGLHWFRRGSHKGKSPALRQCTDEEAYELGVPRQGEMKVLRGWGEGDKRNYYETGYFAINMHPGGTSTTSSWGCQTIPPEDYGFMTEVWQATRDKGQNAIPYVLCLGPIN